MSDRYNVYSSEGRLNYEALKAAALRVAARFPELSASAFFEEVRGEFYPRPDEFDMRGLVLELVSTGDLRYTNDWRVALPLED